MGTKRIGLARVEALMENLKREINWGSASFTGTGLVKLGYVDNATAFVRDSDSIVEWTQPADTLITRIWLLCTVAPTSGTGNSLGFEVGTASSGAEIVATEVDEIIDVGTDGTDLSAGGLVECTVLRKTTDAVTLAADVSYTTAARTLYFNTTCDNAAAVAVPGTMRWIVEYIHFA